MAHLFVYGTLMSGKLLEAVTGCRPEAAFAQLYGYSRHAVRGAPYPGIAPERGSRVDGILYKDISNTAWDLLDRFEGPMYFREDVGVELCDGAREQAVAYVVKPQHRHLLENRDWNFEAFRREQLHRFLSNFA